LLGALVVTRAALRRLINRRVIIMMIVCGHSQCNSVR